MVERREPSILHFSRLVGVERGNGVQTIRLVTERHGTAHFISGVTIIPTGGSVPRHLHNCDEQVTILRGTAQVEVQGGEHRLQAFDTTFVPAGVWHRFANADKDPLVILWIYGALHVTRTFADSGDTVEHLSSGDLTSRT